MYFICQFRNFCPSRSDNSDTYLGHHERSNEELKELTMKNKTEDLTIEKISQEYNLSEPFKVELEKILQKINESNFSTETRNTLVQQVYNCCENQIKLDHTMSEFEKNHAEYMKSINTLSEKLVTIVERTQQLSKVVGNTLKAHTEAKKPTYH